MNKSIMTVIFSNEYKGNIFNRDVVKHRDDNNIQLFILIIFLAWD